MRVDPLSAARFLLQLRKTRCTTGERLGCRGWAKGGVQTADGLRKFRGDPGNAAGRGASELTPGIEIKKA